ncbi:MAG: ABC transporter ATP-binding protein [Gemmatimonadota bacterium]|nr:MAG: ABC transporter ATP-binding protein [Gemmatimonadota bacterium]
MSRFNRLMGFVRRYAGALIVTFIAAVIASVLDGFMFALLIPFLRVVFDTASAVADAPTAVERVLEVVIGFALTQDRGASVRNVVLVILLVIAVKNVAAYGAAALGAYVQEGVGRDMRNSLYAHIQHLGLGFFQRMKGGQLISRMIVDIDQACRIVSAALVSAVQNVVLVAIYLAILFSLSWHLTLITLVLAPTIASIMRPIQLRIRKRMSMALNDRGEVAAIVSETVEGARLVKAHGAEGYERERFAQAAEHYFGGVVKAQRLVALAHPVSETLGAAVVLLLVVVGFSLGVGEGNGMRPELFIPFVVIALRLVSPVKALTQFPMHAEVSLAAADRVFEIVDERRVDVESDDARTFPGLTGVIEFDDVWFAYEPEAWVLRGVSLRVERGEIVAIVGASGAGKSTLVDLLPRFVEPSRGRILLDGVATSEYTRRSLRRAMGIVGQHTVIFNDTVRANIAYGEQGSADMEAVKAAARAANAHEFIERLPQGYDTVLGERGMRLSGGERQRIAIARALLRDPPILILDEATSALDIEAEKLVQGAIERLLENRTVFVIAHRLSTVARADQIVVLQRGMLVERGRHDELVAAGGVYQRLHHLEMVASRP